MKNHLISMAAWLNSDPRRVRMMILTFMLVLMLMALVMPTSISLAGWISGGGD